MKSFSPTRDLRFAVVLGLSLAWVGGVGAQRRGGDRGMRAQTPHQTAPRSFQRGAQQGLQQAPPQGLQQGVRPDREQRAVEQRGQLSQSAPIVRRDPQAQGRGEKGEHLAQWMNQHRNLSPEQQQQALDREPGFRQLPQATQQRMRNRLAQLNAMNPQTRERTQEHIEWMERLSPNQRTEVRGSLEQLGSLPPDQRRQVSRSFRDLRQLPPEQRAAALNSPQYQYMSPAQRAALNNLLRVEPLMPPNGR